MSPRHGYEDRLDLASDDVLELEQRLYDVGRESVGQPCSQCGEPIQGEGIVWARLNEEQRHWYCSWICFHAARDGGA